MHVRYDSSGERSQAFFTPQETTTYVLWFEADNEGELFFGTSANVSNVTRYVCTSMQISLQYSTLDYSHCGSDGIELRRVTPIPGRLSNDACHRVASIEMSIVIVLHQRHLTL